MENNYLLFECDLCHDYFDLQQIRLQENGKEYLCDKCAGNNNLMAGELQKSATLS